MQLSEIVSRLTEILELVGDMELTSYTPHSNVGVTYTFTLKDSTDEQI